MEPTNILSTTQLERQEQPTKKPNKKIIIIIISIAIILTALCVVGGILLFNYIKNNNISNNNINNETSDETIIEEVTTKPLMAPDFLDKSYWKYIRNEYISTQEAKSIIEDKATASKLGYLIPNDLSVFSGSTEYKGIKIMWTSSQPLSETKISWLKNAIDVMPAKYIERYPVIGIYSGTPQELGITDTFTINSLTTGMSAAFASGASIYLTDYFSHGTKLFSFKQPDQDITTSTLIHEWTHVAQFYEGIYTYKTDYLLENSATKSLTTFLKGYAMEVGWDYGDDPLGDYILALLKNDTESRKISYYGTSNQMEDQADAVMYFLECRGNEISTARKEWIEAYFDIQYENICNR